MCIDLIEAQWDPSLEKHVMTSFAVLYTIHFVLGISGNVAVIFLTFRNSRLQSVQNLFILNLAVSDLMIALFSLPITPITNIFKQWYFGWLMCHSLPWIQGTSVFITTFSLTAIAVDRYCMICCSPFERRITRKHAKNITVIMWLASAMLTLPYMWYMKIENYDEFCGSFCTEVWPNQEVRRGYTIVVLLTQFVIPFVIIFTCYYKIFAKLRERASAKIKKLNERTLILAASMPVLTTIKQVTPDSVNVVHKCRQKCKVISQTRRNTLLLVAMLFVFAFAWLPHNITAILMEVTGTELLFNDIRYDYVVSLATHSIAMTTLIANPVLYSLLNPSFTSLLKKTCVEWKNNFRKLQRLETISSNTTNL